MAPRHPILITPTPEDALARANRQIFRTLRAIDTKLCACLDVEQSDAGFRLAASLPDTLSPHLASLIDYMNRAATGSFQQMGHTQRVDSVSESVFHAESIEDIVNTVEKAAIYLQLQQDFIK